MNQNEIRELVNRYYLKVESQGDEKQLCIPITDMDGDTADRITKNKSEIIRYIDDLNTKQGRISEIARLLKQLDEKYESVCHESSSDIMGLMNGKTEDSIDNPYDSLNLNQLDDLNQAIAIAKQNGDDTYLAYFAIKKMILVDYSPSELELEIAKLYNEITKISYEYAKQFSDLWFFEIGGAYREQAVLATKNTLQLVNDKFHTELANYCKYKDYDVNPSI